MTLAEITMPLTRGVIAPLEDARLLLDASTVGEPDGEDAVWVTTTVDGFIELESSGVAAGRELVDEEVRWEDAVRALVEVEVVARVVEIKEGEIDPVVVVVTADSEGCAGNLVVVSLLPFVLVVGEPGLIIFEMKDSRGFCACAVVVVGRVCWRFCRARSIGGMNIVFCFYACATLKNEGNRINDR